MLQVFFALYIVMPLLMFPVVKRRTPAGVLDRHTSLELRGFGMWIIMIAHAVEGKSNNATFFFYASAILGVSICFFLSGYGLYKSSISKPGYLKRFIGPKFLRILLPYVFLSVYVVLFRWLIRDPIHISVLLSDLFRLQLNGALLWYLKVQLLMYVLFWLAFHLPFQYRVCSLLLMTISYIVIARCANLGVVWYNTCIFFPLGVVCGKYEKYIVPNIQKSSTILVALFVFLSTLSVIYLLGRMNLAFIIDPLYMLSFLIFTVGLFSFFSGSLLLKVLGQSSMEVYLVHIILLQKSLPLSKLFNPDIGWTYLLLLVCTLFFSIPLYYLDIWIVKKIAVNKV